MTAELQNQFSKELVVQFINRSGQLEKKRFGFTAEGDPQVDAGKLKHRFLTCFEEAPVENENEPETDENRSYHLTGFDGKGKSTSFQDDETVDLRTYSRFEISPRTTGGGEEENRV
jgi:hypothetical protein